MKYVIVKGKGKKPLNNFEMNDLPIKAKVTIIDRLNNKDIFSDRMFRFYNDCCTTYNTIEEAEGYISTIKKWIKEESLRYENCLEGSTERLMNIANKLRVIPFANCNFGIH